MQNNKSIQRQGRASNHVVLAIGFIMLFSTTVFAQRVTNINNKGTKLVTGNVVTESATAPVTPTPIQGDLWFDTTNNATKVWDGTAWKPLISDGDLFWDADRDTGIQVEESTDDDTIRFDTDGTERAVILPNGNVGIGIATPTYTLDVAGTGRITNPPVSISNDTPVASRTHNTTSLDAYSTSDAIVYATFTTGADVTSNQTIYESGAVLGTELLISGGQLRVYAGNTDTIYNTTPIAANTPYSVAVVYDLTNDELRLYLKAESDSSLTTSNLVSTAAFTQNDWSGFDNTGVGNAAGSARSGISGPFLGTGLSQIDLYTTNDISAISTSSLPATSFVYKEGRAGIGTETPTQTLDVVGQARIRTLNAGDPTDEVVVADADGLLKKRTTASLVQEPWFTVGTTDGHTTNTGDMFFSGNIGVATNTLSAGKVATFAGDVDIQGVLDPTKIILSGDGSVGSFNPTTNNQYEIQFNEGRDLEIKSNTRNNILHIENAGNVGIGTNLPSQKLEVNGNAQIGTPGEELRIGAMGHANWAGIAHKDRAITNNYALMQNAAGATYINASSGQAVSLRINNALGAILDADRNFGINTNTPAYRLDVHGSFRNTTAGLFSVMGGIDDMTATPARGIRMWQWNNTNWGIYMSRPGDTHAMDGGTAPSRGSVALHALRFRSGNSYQNGFMFENSANVGLLSIRGNDGMINNKRLDDNDEATNMKGGMVVSDTDGNILGASGLFRVASGPLLNNGVEVDAGPIYNAAELKGFARGGGCTTNYNLTFHIRYRAGVGFSSIENSGTAGAWTFGGTGTATDPYTATSAALRAGGCSGGATRLRFTISNGRLTYTTPSGPGSTGAGAGFLERLLIETY